MVNVIGILTLETVPGLNRHCRNALVAALSKMGLPGALRNGSAGDIAAGWIDVERWITPLPVTCRDRASYGYCGRGAYKARAFARDIDMGPGALIWSKFLRVRWCSRRRCSFFHKLGLNVRRGRRRLWNRNILGWRSASGGGSKHRFHNLRRLRG